MITRYDEMFCHQVVSTFDQPGTSAREWTERAWMQVHDIGGTAHLAASFGYYPNRNVMDAFVAFAIQGQSEHVVRASRELRPEIDVFRVGPFSYDVVEPLRAVRYRLDDNQYGLSYDITLQGVSPLVEEDPAQYQVSRGRVKEHIKRMVQSVRPTGWIKCEGQTYPLGQDGWVGERDRSWGIRLAGADFIETGVQAPELPAGMLFNFALMQFESWGATYHLREIWDDQGGFVNRWHFGGAVFYPFSANREPLKIVSLDHSYRFRDDLPEQARRFAGGGVSFTTIDGTRREVSIRPVTICYQAPVGYGGFYQGFIHGKWMGEKWMDGHRFDLNNPETMKEIWGYCDYGSEFTCGGEVGHGTVELMVVGKYPRYGYQGY